MNTNFNNEETLLSGMRNMNVNNGPPLPQHQYYGQPPNMLGGYQGQYEQDEDEDDDQPLSFHANNTPRPVSVRNIVTDLNPAKPSQFIKPAPPPSFNTAVANDMKLMQTLYESYSQKVYIEGYIYKKTDLTVDGRPFHGDHGWSRAYVELCGPVLTYWDADMLDNQPVMPQYINITDSNIEILGRYQDRENVFSLNTAGANRYLIDAVDYNSLIQWTCAIRLSCYEHSKLQEIFTRNLITRPTYSDILSKSANKMEGYVQVRFSGSTDWQKFWVVVSDKKEEKKLFGKKSVQSARGQMMFYESKKSKAPVFTLVNVVQSYIIYPESPQTIDLVTMFKVEGMELKSGEEQSTTVLINTPSTKELVQWIIGTLDTFKLYGRPNRLFDDPYNINSLNFGELNSSIPRLFLELAEVLQQVNVHESLTDNKAQLSGILLNKLKQHQQQPSHRFSQQPMGLIHQIPTGAPLSNISSPHPTSQRMSTYSSQSSNTSRSPLPQSIQQRQQNNRQIYASDDEEDEDDDEDDVDEADSDDDAVLNKQKLGLPTMAEDDGFASSLLSNIENMSRTSISSPQPQITKEVVQETPKEVIQEAPKEVVKEDINLSDSESESEDDEQVSVKKTPITSRPKPKMALTQVSLSGSDEESEDDEEYEDDEEEGSDDDDDDDIPIHQQQQQRFLQQQQQQQYMDFNDPRMMQQQYMDAYYQQQNGFFHDDYDEDGPIIPQLGDHFATQNSLLDTYRPVGASAHDQEDYARATGQPLIQVPNKPTAPRAGLVGMISQIEQDKKQKESSKRFEMERERMERERYMMDQRASMMQQPTMMQQGMNPMMPMMYPGMNPGMNPGMSPGMSPGMNPGMSPGMNPGMNPMMSMNMPMMNMMGQQMMYPGMMQMPMMMDPRMSMMMMQQMWQQQQTMFPGRFNNQIPEDDDEDDDVPLGSHTQK